MKESIYTAAILLFVLTGCNDSGYTPTYIISEQGEEAKAKSPPQKELIR